jgi:hypothetical protein
MPKDKDGKKVPLTAEESKRVKGSASELAAAEKAKSKKAEEDKLKSVEDVKAKKVLARDKKSGRIGLGVDTTRVAGDGDQGPSAAPKVQLPGPVVSTGKKLAQKGIRAPKRGELARGITIVDPGPKRKKKTRSKTVVRDANTGRARARTSEDFTRTEVAPVAPKPERSRPSLAPGAGPLREPVYIDTKQSAAKLEEGTKTVLRKDEQTSEFVETSVPMKEWVGGQATRKLKGLAVPHKTIAPAVNQAIKHLDDMAATRGTPEHHSHAESFNAIHPTILGMDATIHHALGVMHSHTMHPKHNSSSVITQIKSAIGDRLSEGKKMETQRAQRQGNN